MCPVCCSIGETPYKHGALESCFPVGFYRGTDPHSGFVCSHSGCLCCEGEEGGAALVYTGFLKLFYSSFLREIEPHSDSVYTHSGFCLWAQSSSVWPHSGYVCCFIARSLCVLL